MEGIELFMSLANDDTTKVDALLVGKNLCNQRPSDQEIFVAYFDYLCKLASYPITTNERKFYAEEADIALAYFSENVKITKKMLLLIKDCKAKLEKVINDIIITENTIAQNTLEEIQDNNIVELNHLIDLKGKLFLVTNRSEFDSLLHVVQKSENKINKEYLTAKQTDLYDTLTAEYSNVVNQKLVEIERLENVAYNKLAVTNFKLVFEAFCSDEVKYKNNQSQLYGLVSKKLFGYDAEKLFNETLIYYNHVYSYIFNKLDEDGKYRLTQFSIESEKLRK